MDVSGQHPALGDRLRDLGAVRRPEEPGPAVPHEAGEADAEALAVALRPERALDQRETARPPELAVAAVQPVAPRVREAAARPGVALGQEVQCLEPRRARDRGPAPAGLVDAGPVMRGEADHVPSVRGEVCAALVDPALEPLAEGDPVGPPVPEQRRHRPRRPAADDDADRRVARKGDVKPWRDLACHGSSLRPPGPRAECLTAAPARPRERA